RGPAAAQEHFVGREVEQLDTAIGVYGHWIILPSDTGRQGELAAQLELIPEIHAVLRAPERNRLRVVPMLLVNQRILERGVSRLRQSEQEIRERIVQIRRCRARGIQYRGAAGELET